KAYAIVDLSDLARFEAATRVSPEQLVEQKLITPAQGRGLVKVLGNGEVDHALTIRVHKVSAGARAKIEAVGGTVEIIPTKVYEKTKRSKNPDTKASTGQGQSTRK
ncbi:MAG: uL15 family ribosomal protein, partial [Chloroflexota bacterium]|nr:uL15 family ribosomal protein [Chloroflexota bacterium]